jgi:hypothetical protein
MSFGGYIPFSDPFELGIGPQLQSIPGMAPHMRSINVEVYEVAWEGAQGQFIPCFFQDAKLGTTVTKNYASLNI